MNEQRQQAYLNLIRSLLDFPSGEEPNILAANQELLDAGFVQTVEEVAQMCSQHGDENTANSLQGLAMQLREVLNLDTKVDLQSLSEEEIQTYYQFLMEVLQATADSKGNSQVVYPLLAKNTDKIDGVLAEILRRWGTNILREAQADEAKSSAGDIVNFSNLILQFPLGSKASNMEIAITGYEVTLTLYTREALPFDWAATQNNLGLAYTNRIKGDRADNIENAIAVLTAALTVRTREALPQDWAETLFNLGIAHQDANQFPKAYNTFESAIATIESLREEIVSGEESKRKQAERFNQVYSRMVEVCRELNEITKAIEYVERSKTRNLVEQILERDSKTIFLPEDFTQLEKYRDEIAVGQYQIQNGKAENPKVLAQHLQELRQQRNELQNQYLPVGYGFKFDSFQASLDEHTAIIEWYILNDKILAFIVTKQGEVTVYQSQPEDREALYDWINKYFQNYYGQKDQWQNNLGKALNQAQQWLRNLTIEEFEIVLEQYKPQIATTLAQMRPGQRLLFQEYLKRIRQGQSLPFANPYHWAAFTATGV